MNDRIVHINYITDKNEKNKSQNSSFFKKSQTFLSPTHEECLFESGIAFGLIHTHTHSLKKIFVGYTIDRERLIYTNKNDKLK